MKKTYIEPTINVTEIESEYILAASNEVKVFRNQNNDDFLDAEYDDEVL